MTLHTYNERRTRVNPSRKNRRCCLRKRFNVICVNVIWWMRVCNERDEGEGGWGEKFSNQKYKEGTCTKMSHEQINSNEYQNIKLDNPTTVRSW